MSKNSQDQEIDLGQIGKGISNFFQKIINKCFDLLFFIQKKIVIIAALFILGLGLGLYLDSKPNYINTIVVIPNFGSNEYLYNKIDLISAKLKQKDKAFFKAIGISNIDNFNSIEIEPVNGIYNFINSGSQQTNFEFIKLMAEDGDLQKVIKDDITSKNYYLHGIIIKTNNAYQRKDLVEPILKYLQQTLYFTQLQKVYQNNLLEKVEANKLLINQIDQIIISITQNKNNGGVTISENSGLSDLIAKKDGLLLENQALAIHKLEYENIIKDQNISLNQMNTKGVNNKLRLILPFLFVLLYLLTYRFIKVYKKHKKRI